MANEIDRVMHEDVLKLTKSDLKTLVAYHRGRRGKEEGEETDKPKRSFSLNLSKLTGADGKPLVKPKPKFTRRF